MTDDEKEFLEVLRGEFFGEASESLDNCESVILSYENSQDPDQITEYKRLLHSIKGSSRAVDLLELSDTLHQMESKCEEELQANDSAKFVKTSLQCIDAIRNYLEQVQNGDDAAATSVLNAINITLKS